MLEVRDDEVVRVLEGIEVGACVSVMNIVDIEGPPFVAGTVTTEVRTTGVREVVGAAEVVVGGRGVVVVLEVGILLLLVVGGTKIDEEVVGGGGGVVVEMTIGVEVIGGDSVIGAEVVTSLAGTDGVGVDDWVGVARSGVLVVLDMVSCLYAKLPGRLDIATLVTRNRVRKIA